MRRIAAAAGVLAAAVSLAAAQNAQTTPPAPMMDIGAGILFTEGSDHFDNGVGAAVYVGGKTLPFIGLRASLSGWDCDTDSPVLSHGSFYITGLDASLLLHLDVEPGLHLWAGGGIGQYWLEDDWDDRDNGPSPYPPVQEPHDDIEDDSGAHVLVGADLIIAGPVSFFLEGKYIWLDADAHTRSWSDDGQSIVETSNSLNLDTGSVLLGVRVRL